MAREETWLFERAGTGFDGAPLYRLAEAILVNIDGSPDAVVEKITPVDSLIRKFEFVDSVTPYLAKLEKQKGMNK